MIAMALVVTQLSAIALMRLTDGKTGIIPGFLGVLGCLLAAISTVIVLGIVLYQAAMFLLSY